MKKSIIKAVLVSFAIAMGLLVPVSSNAQDDLFHGLFGRGKDGKYMDPIDVIDKSDVAMDYNDDFELGLFGRGSTDFNSNGLLFQHFGETQGTITFQSFSEDENGAPIGDGLFILMMAGYGYVTVKKKKLKN